MTNSFSSNTGAAAASVDVDDDVDAAAVVLGMADTFAVLLDLRLLLLATLATGLGTVVASFSISRKLLGEEARGPIDDDDNDDDDAGGKTTADGESTKGGPSNKPGACITVICDLCV